MADPPRTVIDQTTELDALTRWIEELESGGGVGGVEASPGWDQLHQILERYRAVSTQSPAGVWQIDLEGRTKYMNQAMCDLLGLGSPAAIGDRSFDHFFTPESVTRIRAEQEKRLPEGEREALLEAYRVR